ncbi:MAG TPA: hypothetical protein VMK42_10160 [Anaeromyxobacteraceae bacterium]|nr:hypothetical protein [Anaeromyxobacteraceae bacterium]
MKGALLALSELRTRLLWRRLTARGGLAEGVARATLLLLAIPTGLLFAVMLGAGTWQAVRAGGGLRTDVTATAVFLGIWQTWTAVTLSLNDREGVDLRRFLVYPIPPGRVYGLGLAAGLVGDPVAIFWAVLLAGILAGAALARPGGWLTLLALLLLLFAAATVLYAALLQELLAMALGSRRLREWATVFSVLAAVAVLGFLAASSARPLKAFAEALPALRLAQWIAWPGALAAGAARHLYAGRGGESLPWLVGLAAGGLAAGRLAFALALRQARSGGEGGARARGGALRAVLFPQAGMRGALWEKEAKYLLRHPLARTYGVLVPVIAAFVGFGLEPRLPRESGEVVRAVPLLGLAVYTHLSLQGFWLNALGWERGGARLLYLSPLDVGELLRAKNAVLFLFSLAVFALSAAILLLPSHSTPAWAVGAAAALHAGMAPYLYGLGNLVSVLNPRAASFAIQRSASLPALSGLAGLGIVSSVSGLFALPVVLALRLESPSVLIASWLALGVVGLWAYRRALPSEARLLLVRREELLSLVCGDDA